MSVPKTDDKGNIHFTLQYSALNGLTNTVGFGRDPIDGRLNFVVTPGRQVGIEAGSAMDLYPSRGIYEFRREGLSFGVKTLYEQGADPRGLKMLAQPMAPIPVIAPQ